MTVHIKFNDHNVTLSPGNFAHYNILRAGWLMACYSEKNIAKGEKILSNLSDKDKDLAIAYKLHCLRDAQLD